MDLSLVRRKQLRKRRVPGQYNVKISISVHVVLLLLVSCLCFCGRRHHVHAQETNNEERRHVLIGYTVDTESTFTTMSNTGSTSTTGGLAIASQLSDFRVLDNVVVQNTNASSAFSAFSTDGGEIHIACAVVTDAELAALENDKQVVYVEDDPLVSPLQNSGGEIITYGMQQIQATKALPKTSHDIDYSLQQYNLDPCEYEDSFRVAIIDSGLATNHPDLPSLASGSFLGREFGQGLDSWNRPSDVHGTHVFGTIAAIRDNGIGVRGILDLEEDADGSVSAGGRPICFLIGRVFGEGVASARLSDILSAVTWASDNGAHVINLSLGGGSFSTTANNIYKQIVEKGGALVIAAAGNDGSTELSYPASYDTVMSVAAVDENEKRAAFSQTNDQVDISAPGSGILSTVPLNIGSGITQVTASNGASFSGQVMENSVGISSSVSGVLVECPDLGKSVCPGISTGPHICVILRGDIFFEDKALNCEKGGGVGAIIWNNEAGMVSGTLSSPTMVTIPVIGVSRKDGLEILRAHLTKSASISMQRGYGYSDGTSFATPHVSGAASSIWHGCPQCSNFDIRYCLEETAKDLGTSGRDNQYGHGLVQMYDAFHCLVEDVQCCELAKTEAPVPAPVAVPAPAPSPSTPGEKGCGSSEDTYQNCLAEMTSQEAADCRACVNSAIPRNIKNANCDDIRTGLCPAIHSECNCGDCRNEIDYFLSCTLDEMADCPLDCTSGDNNSIVDPTCEFLLFEMRECFDNTLSLSSGEIGPANLDPERAPGCETCVKDTFIDSYISAGNLACLGIEAAVCPALQQCGCQECIEHMEDYVSCAYASARPEKEKCDLSCSVGLLGGSKSASMPSFDLSLAIALVTLAIVATIVIEAA